jgi:hypothetical protein
MPAKTAQPVNTSPQHNIVSLSDHRARRAAERTQREVGEVERLPFDLSALDAEGIFVNVDASGFGLLDRRIDWQALGITLPNGTDVAFHPPRCGVLPNRFRRPLLTPASQAHAALHKFSYRFRLTETLFETPAYRWLPWRAFPAFEAAFNVAAQRLETARQQALDAYDTIRAEVLETFTQLAADSYQRLLATGIAPPVGFRERIRDGVLDALPSEDELRHKLRLRYQVGVILLGSEMLREQRAALVEKQRLAQAQAETALAEQHSRVAAAAVQQQLWTEQESTRLRLAAEAEEHRREAEVKEHLRQLKLAAAREQLHDALSPLQEGAAQLRAQVYEAATAMHAALLKNDFLPGATAKKARQLAEWFRLMNFQSDAELEGLLTQLEGLAAKSTGKKRVRPTNGQIQAALDDILTLCYRDAQTITQSGRLGALEL